MFEKGEMGWSMMADYFQLVKKCWDVKDDDAWWDAAIDEVDIFSRKYMTGEEEMDFFVKGIALKVLERAEIIEKGKWRQAEPHEKETRMA